MDGRIMRPRRHNGLPYSGNNVLMLWLAAEEHGFTSPRGRPINRLRSAGGMFVRAKVKCRKVCTSPLGDSLG